MNKFIKGRWLAIIVCLIFILSACSNASSNQTDNDSEESIVLRVSSALGPGHNFISGYFTVWQKLVEEKTNGQVTFEMFPSGELVTLTNEVRALNSGTIDIAMPIFPLYDPQTFPLSEVVMLPVLNTNSEIAADAYKKLFESEQPLIDGKTYYELEFAHHDLKLFPIPPTDQYEINSVTKTFYNVSDFKGSLFRIGNRVHEVFSENIGGTPVTIAVSDTYEAITRGTVDANVGSVGDWNSGGYEDVMKFNLEGPSLGHYVSLMGMTNDKWNSLPENVRQAMEEAHEEAYAATASFHDEQRINNKEYALNKGATFVHISELDADTQELLAKGAEETWINWIEGFENRELALEIAKQWRDYIIESGGEVAEKIKEME